MVAIALFRAGLALPGTARNIGGQMAKPNGIAERTKRSSLLDAIPGPLWLREVLVARWASGPIGHDPRPPEPYLADDVDILPGDCSPIAELGKDGSSGRLGGIEVDAVLDLWDAGDPDELRELAAVVIEVPAVTGAAVPDSAASEAPALVEEFLASVERHGQQLRDRARAAARDPHVRLPPDPRVAVGETVQLAFYRSFRHSPAPLDVAELVRHGFAPRWGIYLHSYGVELTARAVYLPLGFSPTECLSLAIGDLLAHELAHATIDAAVVRALLPAAAMGAPVPGPIKPACPAGCTECEMEEAVCEAAVHRAIERRVDDVLEAEKKARDRLAEAQKAASWQPTTVPIRAAAHAQAQLNTARTQEAARSAAAKSDNAPSGYNQWRNFMATDKWLEAATHVMIHRGADELVAGTVLRDTLERLRAGDPPVRLVATEGSAYHRDEWRLSLF